MNISRIYLKLTELQADDQQAKKNKAKRIIKESWKNVDEILYFQSLLYISKIIYIKLIS